MILFTNMKILLNCAKFYCCISVYEWCRNVPKAWLL